MAACRGATVLEDKELHCQLSAGHDDPETPDGEELAPIRPHESEEHTDQLTGEPWRWW